MNSFLVVLYQCHNCALEIKRKNEEENEIPTQS